MSKTCAIVPAAGRGVRMGAALPKQFLELCGRPILAHTLNRLQKAPFISGVLLVLPEAYLEMGESMVARYCTDSTDSSIRVVAGGAERQDSVRNGLERLPEDCEWVLIHDGVRPFASDRLIEATWKAARPSGAAIAAVPSSDTVKRVEGGCVLETLRREEIWLVQTPQVFRKDLLIDAYTRARAQGWVGTDDASLVEWTGGRVAVVSGERTNVKVTTAEDLAWAQWFLAREGGACG